MPDDDDGWGGTSDPGWGESGNVAGPPPPAFGPSTGSPTFSPPSPDVNPSAAQRSDKGRRNKLVLTIAAAVVAIVVVGVVVVVVVSTSHHGSTTPVANGPTQRTHSDTVQTTTPNVSPSPTPTSTIQPLSAVVPFGDECQQAPAAEHDTAAVTDQVLCAGPKVTSAVSAAGISYARFPDADAMNSWYTATILQANNITSNSGNCETGTTVTTTLGAQYCEGPFTDDTGDSTARQTVIRAPSNVMLTNGPNSSSASCPGSDFTVLVFTSPSDNVGVIAQTCSSSAAVANAFESALSNGDFDLNS